MFKFEKEEGYKRVTNISTIDTCWKLAQEEILSQLKSPSSAQFGSAAPASSDVRVDNARSNYYRDMNRQKRRPGGKVVSFDEVISPIYSDNANGACIEILGGVSENYHNTIVHQIIDKLELDNLMDEFDRDNQRKIFELLIVGYSQKDIRKLLEINLYRWKKLMTDMKELVGKYLDECYND